MRAVEKRSHKAFIKGIYKIHVHVHMKFLLQVVSVGCICGLVCVRVRPRPGLFRALVSYEPAGLPYGQVP